MTRFFIISIFLMNVLTAKAQGGWTEEEARHLIDSLYTVLVKGGDFTTLAQTYSDDPGSKDNGGKFLNYKKGIFVPEFEEAALRLDVGGISQPFKTQFGYHVVQLMSRNKDVFSVRHILIAFKQ